MDKIRQIALRFLCLAGITIMISGCAPTGNMRNELLLEKDDLPYLNEKFSCDDLFMWRQEVYMIFDRKLKAQEKQLKKHQ